ncbi:hypothetical protein [Marinactinospora rubrisoli]|uniref:Secreted protein n=1 Tax=Marinactinospora rubrisoli TaxID=2715399 RepID=A0ABW2KDT9_9ACTN
MRAARSLGGVRRASALIAWACLVVGRKPTSRAGSSRRRRRSSFAEVMCGRRTTETLTRIACSLPGGTPGRSVSIAE